MSRRRWFLFVAWWILWGALGACALKALAHNGAPRDVDRAIHRHFGYGYEAGNAFAVASCESGFDIRAAGTYRGLWQFSAVTWRGLGGRGDPASATADEQTRVARKLWVSSGRTFSRAWPVCGRGR